MDEIVVLNFGGQYAHLIANRLRRLGAYATLKNLDTPFEELKRPGIKGIILSGGGDSVNDEDSPTYSPCLVDLDVPILGICYGFQWLAKQLDGKVEKTTESEYGGINLIVDTNNPLFKGVDRESTCWMSHWDSVISVPPSYKSIAHTTSCPIAGIMSPDKKKFGIQFHPEVTHTKCGEQILKNFIEMCHPEPWSIDNYYHKIKGDIEKIDKDVFILVSGGVDSSVAFALLNNILGPDRVHGVMVDTGLMRKDEANQVKTKFNELGYKLHVANSQDMFINRLKNVFEPEQKRKIIGDTFLDVKDEVAKELKLEDGKFLLAQGTIYPDTIESGCANKSKKIKTHHNRVDKITELIKKGEVIEPLKDLYKDEVRELGRFLKLPNYLIDRHPFPGPGLGVRILCCNYQLQMSELEREIVDDLINSKVDTSGIRKLRILPVKSVGVQGDERSYKYALVIFLEDIQKIDYVKLTDIATIVPNIHREINRVLFCINKTDVNEFEAYKSFISNGRINLLQDIDNDIDQIMFEDRLHDQIWQFPVVLIPVGNKHRESIVLRPVNSREAMTADVIKLELSTLNKINDRLKDYPIDYIFYDLTNKPPGTIEWE